MMSRGGPNPYYVDVHQETQAPGHLEYVDPLHDDRTYNRMALGGGGGGNGGIGATGRRRQEDDYLFQSGQFNPEAAGRNQTRGGHGFDKDDDEESKKGGECRSTLREMAELCPCICCCCMFLPVV